MLGTLLVRIRDLLLDGEALGRRPADRVRVALAARDLHDALAGVGARIQLPPRLPVAPFGARPT